MILGVVITALSFIAVIYQIWVIEQNKAEILSLYALLQMDEITRVYQACDDYLETLNQGRIVARIGLDKDPSNEISGSR